MVGRFAHHFPSHIFGYWMCHNQNCRLVQQPSFSSTEFPGRRRIVTALRWQLIWGSVMVVWCPLPYFMCKEFLSLLPRRKIFLYILPRIFILQDDLHISCGERFSDAASQIWSLNSSASQLLAVGVNCTAADNATKLISSVKNVPLILYPNSGQIWDAKKKV